MSDCNNDVEAEALYVALGDEADFAIPVVDLNGAQFTIPAELDNDLYTPLSRLTEADLTTRKLEGTGLFDGLMEATNAQLQEQYDSGRITGSEFASAYVSGLQSAMGNAVQYLLSRDTTHWQAVVAQQQARAAELEVVKTRLMVEESKARMLAAQLDVKTKAAQLALGKMQLVSEDVRTCLLRVQKSQAEYELTNILPIELAKSQSQIAATDAGTAQTNAQTVLLGTQEAQAEYELANILPIELAKSQAQIAATDAGTLLTTSQKDKTLYETASVLPAQIAKINSDKEVSDYTWETVMPAQVAGITADTVGKVYNNDFILPEQRASIKEQTEAHRAKTLDTRSDGVTPITGAIGKQKDLHTQQVKSYQDDSQTKLIKILTDTWITGKSMDENYGTPSAYTEGYVNSAVAALRANLGLPAS